MTFVNWKHLETALSSFKKNARSEILNPSDRVFLDENSALQESVQQQLPTQDKSQDPAETRQTNLLLKAEPEADKEIEYIEVENAKGKIKKIDPNDYEVMIIGSNLSTIHGKLSDFKEPYQSIAIKYGAKEALRCLMRDKVPEEKELNFREAKMIISSIVKTSGTISNTGLDKILQKVDFESKINLETWLSQNNIRAK